MDPTTGPTRSGRLRLLRLLALVSALVLLLAACPAEEPDDTEEPADEPDEEEPENGEISIGWIPWEENIANTNLWAEILEEQGYQVDTQELDPGVLFEGVATGDVDLFLDVWLPGTHESYWEEHGDDVIDLGVWYEPATLELTVPQYVVDEHGIETLEDLAENPDVFDGEIVGIEPGAGMMEILQDEEDGVLVTYGMEDDFEVLESSTPAMRSELAAAIEAEEPIVVTLWSPHPEYAIHDLHRLEDPEGAWGEDEELHAIAREGFDEDFPEVTQWLENFELEDEELAELSALIEEYDEQGLGDEREAARAWMDDNEDVWQAWLDGDGGVEDELDLDDEDADDEDEEEDEAEE